MTKDTLVHGKLANCYYMEEKDVAQMLPDLKFQVKITCPFIYLLNTKQLYIMSKKGDEFYFHL